MKKLIIITPIVTIASLVLGLFVLVSPVQAADVSGPQFVCEFAYAFSGGSKGCSSSTASVPTNTTTSPTTTPAPAPKPTARETLLRTFDSCTKENADFGNTLVLQEGSQSACAQYVKTFYKIVIGNSYNPDTWQDPGYVFDAETASNTGAFQAAMTFALNNPNNKPTGTDLTKLINSDAVKQNPDGSLALNSTVNQINKSTWFWINVFTYLYLVAHPS